METIVTPGVLLCSMQMSTQSFDSVSVLKSWHDLGGMTPFALYCRPDCICSQTYLDEVELFLPSLYSCNIALGLSFSMRS